MAVPDNYTDDSTNNDDSVWEAVKTCESILEKNPGDITALSALASSLERVGEAVQAHDLYLQLAEALEKEEKYYEMLDVAEHLLTLTPNDDTALELKQRAETNINPEIENTSQSEEIPSSARPKRELEFDLNAELDLAWMLLQDELINQDQYEKSIDGLTESRMNVNSEATLALLQVLAEMDRIMIDKIIAFLPKKTNTPYIDLDFFSVPSQEVWQRISFRECQRLGISVFGAIEGELLVATLNPLDTNFKTRIEDHLESKAHFYFTSPKSLQNFLRKIKEKQQ